MVVGDPGCVLGKNVTMSRSPVKLKGAPVVAVGRTRGEWLDGVGCVVVRKVVSSQSRDARERNLVSARTIGGAFWNKALSPDIQP